MTKENIKTGYTVIFNNGNNYKIIEVNRKPWLLNTQTFKAFITLDDSLICNELKDSIITTVYDEKNKLIWTRPVEMTISEIEEVLKLTPGSLRIKD